MPHKRAKRSVRDKCRSEAGSDIPPLKQSLSNEGIPKSVARVLNAAKIQQDWREKHKRRSEDAGQEAGPARKKQKKDDGSEAMDLRIKPGESMAHFNRRVEDSLRGTVRAAVQTASAVERRARKEEETNAKERKNQKSKSKAAASTKGSKPLDREQEEVSSPPSKHSVPKDFIHLSTSTPRRLNDVVQAPPEIKKLPRGAKMKTTVPSDSTTRSLKEGVLSMAQKAMLEEERERVIKLYREMKKKNLEGS